VDEQQNTLYVHLRNGTPAMAQEVITELKIAFGDQSVGQRRIQVLPATYTISELSRWHDQLAVKVLDLPDVTFTGIDHTNNKVVVGIVHSNARSLVSSRLGSLSVPYEALSFMETGPIVPTNSLLDRNRPMVGGLQIGSPTGFCSLGFVAERVVPIGPLGFVTASHCSNPDDVAPGVLGSAYTQPADGDEIGIEGGSTSCTKGGKSCDKTADPRFHGCHCILGICLFQCRASDSAFVLFDSAVANAPQFSALGLIASTPLGFTPPPEFLANPLLYLGLFATAAGSTDWDGESFFRIASQGVTFPGMNVTKVGAKTGRTDGLVVLTGLTVPLLKKSFPYVTRKLLQDQVLATYLVEPGDSGAPVFHIPLDQFIEQIVSGGDATPSLVGVNWAGLGALISGLPGALFSPIDGVQKDLGPLNFTANLKPDLLAVLQPGHPSFCEAGQVRIRATNVGGASADASFTRVAFPGLGKSDEYPVPMLSPNASYDLPTIAVPPSCTECSIVITVDAERQVDEGPGEGNNTVSVGCVIS
jgi:hypothetical protein